MAEPTADFWTDDTSVFFTSFWGWTPETWGTVGWTGDKGLAHRTKLLGKLTDPFICAIYVTREPTRTAPELEGKIAGFYLMSHQTGDRNEFTHPNHHTRHTDKWRHSLRALRAFSYISEPLPDAREFEPTLRTGAAQAVASWGKIIEDPTQLAVLRQTPWREVPLYRAGVPIEAAEEASMGLGMVPAGPMATQPYLVSPSAALLERRLYVMRLDGDTSAYLGKPADGRAIYKVGLSVSPEFRRRGLQKSMPLGAFVWKLEHLGGNGLNHKGYPFDAAVAGETAMKVHLRDHGEHLGGEFYLATPKQIEEAWTRGHAAALQHGQGG